MEPIRITLGGKLAELYGSNHTFNGLETEFGQRLQETVDRYTRDIAVIAPSTNTVYRNGKPIGKATTT